MRTTPKYIDIFSRNNGVKWMYLNIFNNYQVIYLVSKLAKTIHYFINYKLGYFKLDLLFYQI